MRSRRCSIDILHDAMLCIVTLREDLRRATTAHGQGVTAAGEREMSDGIFHAHTATTSYTSIAILSTRAIIGMIVVDSDFIVLRAIIVWNLLLDLQEGNDHENQCIRR